GRTLSPSSLVLLASRSSDILVVCHFNHKPLQVFFFERPRDPRAVHSFPTRRSSDLSSAAERAGTTTKRNSISAPPRVWSRNSIRSEEHTSELQSLTNLVCRLLLEKKKREETRPASDSRSRGAAGAGRSFADARRGVC